MFFSHRLSSVSPPPPAKKQHKQPKGRKVYAPDMGLEPMTLRLKVWCSTDWANRAHLNLYVLKSKRVTAQEMMKDK